MKTLEERFWSKVNVAGAGDCWEWTASKHTEGYGQFSKEKNKTVGTHRVAWELIYGPIPEGLSVCHHCDNKICVNPAHLFIGTQKDNQIDMVRKNRQSKGGDRPLAKLYCKQVASIREEYAQGNITQKRLGTKYGVARSTISYIISRKSWRYIQ